MSKPTLFLCNYGAEMFMFDMDRLRRYYNVVDVATPVTAVPSSHFAPGVDKLVNAIHQTPGPFAIAGYSFGARIASHVYNEIRYGELEYRNEDFLGAVVGGNPCREAGRTLPGAVDPGGHGIAKEEDRLVDTEDRWWEMAAPGDIIAINDDGAGGLLATAVWEFIYNDFEDGWEHLVGAVEAAFEDEPLDTLVSIAGAIFNGLTWGIPHNLYMLYRPIPDDPRNNYEISRDYLIKLAQSVPNLVPEREPLVKQLNRIEAECEACRAEHRALRKAKPLIRFWMNKPDGSPGLNYVGRVDYDDTIRGSFPFKNNEPSQGLLELRDDHYMAVWLKKLPNDPDLKKNVVITVDFYGGKKRWSGLLDNWTIKTKDGVKYLEVTFQDDLTYLQYLLCPPNPLLPIPVFQFPRIFGIAGPAKWCISTIILLNVMRVEGNWWTIPDDPFDIDSWTEAFDWSGWQVLVKANSFLWDDSSLWTFLSARMNPIDAVIADALEDAQLTIQYRRIITDDGEQSTVPGVNTVANGVLVFEVVDNSEAHALEGTFFEGTIADGFTRSVMVYGGGFVEDTLSVVGDDMTLQPDEYYRSGWMATVAKMPWLVVRDSEWTPIESGDLSWGPAKNVSVVVGGDNPAADAIAKLVIEVTGNLLGYFLLGGFSSAGTIASDVIMPFLVGTIAAWLHWKNTGRVQQLGWAHYWELYQQGAENNSWSLSALSALRGGFLVGGSETVHTMTLHDSWVIPGVHIDVGQRMGSTVNSKGVEDIIWVNQLHEMVPAWDNSDSLEPLTWALKVGKSVRAMTIGERIARLGKKMSEALNNVGVHLVQT